MAESFGEEHLGEGGDDLLFLPGFEVDPAAWFVSIGQLDFEVFKEGVTCLFAARQARDEGVVCELEECGEGSGFFAEESEVLDDLESVGGDGVVDDGAVFSFEGAEAAVLEVSDGSDDGKSS